MTTGDVGRSKWELDTPVLLADLDVVEANIERLARYCRAAGVAWRPHTKGQKVPALAHKELAAGAIGITCAKLGEAEVMAAAGVRDILVANQVVGPAKAARLANLLRHADVIVTVDSLENAEELSTAASRKGQTLRVLVEVNVGMNRAGVQPGEPAVRLSGKVAALPGLRYVGLMGWEGHCAGIADAVEKRRAIETAVGALVETAERCRQAGLAVEIVSCGGTSTFQGDRAHPRRDRDPGGRRHLRRCPLSEPGGRSSSRAHRPQHGDQPAHADPGDRRRGSQGDECRRGASAAEGSGRGHGGHPLR